MANLTRQEFTQAVSLLAADIGLQRLRDKFVRYNALVTRRGISSPEVFADQLYTLTSGLRRQIAATLAFHTIWNEQIHTKLGKEGEEALEAVANEINACLDEKENIVGEKRAELEEKLTAYETQLAAAVGPERARIDMLLKAVPEVLVILRAKPVLGQTPDV